ncbi:MAG: hypothetical protein AAGG02_06935 [Cyanobacteria bacterium P01_H01_bin.15]
MRWFWAGVMSLGFWEVGAVVIAQAQPSNLQANNPWQPIESVELMQTWQGVLSSPQGVAALNQLAIEGFISFDCPKRLYRNTVSAGQQFLLQVTCPTERGTSTALGYREMRIRFNRFENNIESFNVERITTENPGAFPLPAE